jgi:hypothetical protein
MRYSALGQSKEMDVTSLILDYDVRNSNVETNMIMFHCPVCKTPVFQYGGRMIAILPGLVPNTNPPIVVRCIKCQKKYLLLSISTL